MKLNNKILSILLTLSLLLNLLFIVHLVKPEKKPYLDGNYVADFSKGIGERSYYFDIVFYENGTAFVKQRSYGRGTLADLDTTCPYYYSTESDTATITINWFGNPKTYSFIVSEDQNEIYDSGFTLIRNFVRDAENMALLPPKE